MLTKIENPLWMLEEEARDIYADKYFLFSCPDIINEKYNEETSLIQVLYIWDKQSESVGIPVEVREMDGWGRSEGPYAGGEIQIGAIIYED